jgi:hypothetical protein
MERTLNKKIFSVFLVAILLSSCAQESIAELKENETSELSAFDLCVRNNALQLVSSEGTPGEIADFVMNSCDTEYHHYKDALLSMMLKRSPHPEENKDEYEQNAEKLAMNMWDKIRLKVVKLVEKKRGSETSGTPRSPDLLPLNSAAQ